MLLTSTLKLLKSIIIALPLLTLSQLSIGQEASNEVIASALIDKTSHFPSLGMKVLSVDGNKHVLMSNNGRYIIKGTLQDLWTGVERSFVEINPVNYAAAAKIFEFMNRDDLSISFGNSNGTPIDIFLSYSCKQCKLLTEQIMASHFLERFHVNIFVVYANDLDKKIAEDVFCGSDQKESFVKRFVTRDITNLKTSCAPKQPSLSIGYANVLPVRSLPATLSYNKSLYYGALPENF
jgi:hypothetical protein|tara:strand:+ start:42685 stop:43392 length:708 start_codon:yes stop_codon:yes gene_type:complete